MGFAILEISKLIMLQYWHHIQKRYGKKATLLFTDTDSLMFKVETEDFYKDMEEDIDMYDTSNLPEDHPLYSVQNKKQLYKMKDEAKGNIITEFIGLKSKMYSYKMIDRKTGEEIVKKKAKGLLKRTKKGLTHQEYYESLTNFKCDHYVRERKFQCKNHKITTIIQNRMGINGFDDKSYILDDGITQLRHNHWRVKAYKVMGEWCIGHRQKQLRSVGADSRSCC